MTGRSVLTGGRRRRSRWRVWVVDAAVVAVMAAGLIASAILVAGLILGALYVLLALDV